MTDDFQPGLPAVLEWNAGTEGKNGVLRLLEQTRLPTEETYVEVADTETLADCIKRLAVRGAPALGCAGAYGVMLAAQEVPGLPEEKSAEAATATWKNFLKRCEKVALARPTAVNLKWAVERVIARAVGTLGGTRREWLAAILAEARAVHEEDARMCAEIGRRGAAYLLGCEPEEIEKVAPGKSLTVMTHCNAGALATGGMGTATAPLYVLHEAGAKLRVFADETRPLSQGARLTSWELSRAGISVAVICDSAAASVMRGATSGGPAGPSKKVDAVIVGADRVAANGDVANKIGTYGLAVSAKQHGIRFCVAAPTSTLDAETPDGAAIPIEQRGREEIARPEGNGGRLWVPEKAKVFNPAFDVTPVELVDALITEKAVLAPPSQKGLAALLR